MQRAARPVEHIVDEIEGALAAEIGLVAELDLDLVGERALLLHAIAREGQVVALAHVEIEVDRVDRDDGREQGRRARRGPAAGDQIADRDQMRADAPGERGHDPAMLDVELGVADLRLGLVDGSLPRLLVGRALLDAFRRAGVALLQRLGTDEFTVGQLELGGRTFELRHRLGQAVFVRPRIDDEQQIALLDDVAILEMDLGQGAADLRAQLDLVDRRELAEESQARIELVLERRADDDLRKLGRPGMIRGFAWLQRVDRPGEAGRRNRRSGADPDLARGSPTVAVALVSGAGPGAGFAHFFALSVARNAPLVPSAPG